MIYCVFIPLFNNIILFFFDWDYAELNQFIAISKMKITANPMGMFCYAKRSNESITPKEIYRNYRKITFFSISLRARLTHSFRPQTGYKLCEKRRNKERKNEMCVHVHYEARTVHMLSQSLLSPHRNLYFKFKMPNCEVFQSGDSKI